MSMLVWHERPPEEAHHFNSAYCGALVYEFVRSYTKAKGRTPLFALVFCAMPIALHPNTRDKLPRSTITGLYPWIENNPEALVGFADRAKNLTPFVREAVQYAVAREAIDFEEGGRVALGTKRASFPASFMAESTTDIRDTVDAIRKIGRWFAGAGGTATILAAWGVRV